MQIKSKKTKEEFVKYLQEHPRERFWQAVRNFSKYTFILATNDPAGTLTDTFYWEELEEQPENVYNS